MSALEAARAAYERILETRPGDPRSSQIAVVPVSCTRGTIRAAPRRRKREWVIPSGDVGAWEFKQFGVELLWFVDKFMDLMEKFRMYVSS